MFIKAVQVQKVYTIRKSMVQNIIVKVINWREHDTNMLFHYLRNNFRDKWRQKPHVHVTQHKRADDVGAMTRVELTRADQLVDGRRHDRLKVTLLKVKQYRSWNQVKGHFPQGQVVPFLK